MHGTSDLFLLSGLELVGGVTINLPVVRRKRVGNLDAGLVVGADSLNREIVVLEVEGGLGLGVSALLLHPGVADRLQTK